MARSAATAAKETSVNDAALEDTSKHVIDAVQAESTETNTFGDDAVNAGENIRTEHTDPEPVQHCPLRPGHYGNFWLKSCPKGNANFLAPPPIWLLNISK